MIIQQITQCYVRILLGICGGQEVTLELALAFTGIVGLLLESGKAAVMDLCCKDLGTRNGGIHGLVIGCQLQVMCSS